MAELAGRRLGARFYRRPPEVVARALLGKVLVHGDRAGIIVETEAYQGPEDRASHARFGPTDRNRVMFGPGGVTYVYLCYGMYDLFNVVAGPDGAPGAVLVRALEPHRGLPDDPACARGPGKLTRALAISRDHNGLDLTASGRLTITRGRTVPRDRVAVGPRVGVDYAGDWAEAPLRFWIDGSPAVSKHPGRRPPRKRSQR
jgi:DNA-3-methyladenine glycosylase